MKNNSIYHSVILFLLISMSNQAAANGNAFAGQKLHNQNCTSCHDSRIYTRPNRIIHSYVDLKRRVKFCESNNGLDWNTQEIEDVATYLNQKHYKFNK